MRVWNNVRASLNLLSARDRRMLIIVTAIQMLVSFLDLLGIVLLGTVAVLATSVATGNRETVGGLLDFSDRLPNGIEFVISLAIISAMILILKSIFALLLTRKTFRFLANRQAMVAGYIAQRLLNRPLLEVQTRSSQEISVALTSGVSALTLTTLGQAVVIAAEASLVIALFLGLLFVDPLVAVFTICFFGVLVIILHLLLGSWAVSLGKRFTSAEIGSIEAMQHALNAYREIIVTGRRSLFITRFQGLRWDAARVLSDTFILNQIGKYVFEIGLVIGAGLLVALMAATQDLAAAIAIITVFLAASARLFPSLLRMQAALSNIRGAEGSASVTLHLINSLDMAEKGDHNQLLVIPAKAEEFNESIYSGFDGFVPSVSVRSVTLGYPGASKLALDSVSLEISPGQSIALVGTTGAGKSTLADIVLGVLTPDSGSILISDLEPANCIQRWPGAMAYVPQNVVVLSGSVRENVALGIPPQVIDDSLVWQALKRAHLSEYLENSRDGLNTLVGENGVQLSGGQRQRLGIARALYSRPRLLVLDEATSALDSETERSITETLESLAGQVTLIIIAHRLATVRHCSQVIYLSEGRILGVGTFDEVRTQVPDFDRQADLLGL